MKITRETLPPRIPWPDDDPPHAIIEVVLILVVMMALGIAIAVGVE